MNDLAVGGQTVLRAEGAEAVAANHVDQGVIGTAPVLRADGIDGVTVVVRIVAFLDADAQVIQLLLGVQGEGVNVQIRGDIRADVQAADVLVVGDILGGAIHGGDTQLEDVRAVKILAEGDVVAGIGGQVVMLQIVAVHTGVRQIGSHVGEQTLLGRLEQNREFGAGGVVQIGNDGVRNIAGCQLRGHNRLVAFAGSVAEIKLDAGQLCDSPHHGGAVDVSGQRIADIIDIALDGDGSVGDPGVGSVLCHGSREAEQCQSESQKGSQVTLHVHILHS